MCFFKVIGVAIAVCGSSIVWADSEEQAQIAIVSNSNEDVNAIINECLDSIQGFNNAAVSYENLGYYLDMINHIAENLTKIIKKEQNSEAIISDLEKMIAAIPELKERAQKYAKEGKNDNNDRAFLESMTSGLNTMVAKLGKMTNQLHVQLNSPIDQPSQEPVASNASVPEKVTEESVASNSGVPEKGSL